MPSPIVNAKVKLLSRELHHVVKLVRRGPPTGLGGRLEEDEDEDNALVTGPMEQWINKMIKGTPFKKDIKKEPQTPAPSTSKPTNKPASSSRKTTTPFSSELQSLREREGKRYNNDLKKRKRKDRREWKGWKDNKVGKSGGKLRRNLEDDFDEDSYTEKAEEEKKSTVWRKIRCSKMVNQYLGPYTLLEKQL